MRFFREIHLWLSVPFGVFITLICFSGAMLIFEPEITRAVKSDIYYVSEVKDTPLPMDRLMETVKASLSDSVSVTGVTVFADRERTYQVALSKPRRASLFIDQYSGNITGSYERIGFFSTMFKLHRWLLDSANPHGDGLKVGKLLVGFSTLAFVIALLTGVVIWVPRARKKFRRSITISFSNGWKGFWKSLHVAGGMYALIFVLAMALTGLTWSFDWYRSGFYAVCGVEHTPRNFTQPKTEATPAEAEPGRTDRSDRRGGSKPEGGEAAEAPEMSAGRANRGGNEAGEGRRRGGRGGRHDANESTDEVGAKIAAGEDGVASRDAGNTGRGSRDGGRRHSEFGRWQKVYDEIHTLNPHASQITIAPESATVTLGNTGNSRAADRYTFDRRSGEISPATMYADAVEADKLRGWIYSIHTGSLGGIFTRILWLLGALLGATLPLTGYYIWIKHLMKKKS